MTEIIESHRGWSLLDWRGIWQYRDLLFLMVRRDFVSKYKQTLLGPLWFVLQPLVTAIVFVFLFSEAMHVPTDGVPPVLFYLCGLLVWSYLSQCLNATATSLLFNSQLFKKVYFPRLIVPISYTISYLLAFLVQLLIFLGFYAYFKWSAPFALGFHVSSSLSYLPLLILQTGALSLGMGLWVAALTARYRDFHYLMNFAVPLWMYATPISYPIHVIPERWRFVIECNPASAIVELFRHAFFNTGMIETRFLVLSASVTFAILFSGLFYFSRIERTFIDTI